MQFIQQIKAKVILLHILFWVVVWFFFAYFFSYNSDDKAYVSWFSSSLLIPTMIVAYIMVYFLIPKYLLSKRYLLFALYSFYTFVFSSYLIMLAIYACLFFLLGFDTSDMPPMSKNYVFILILVYLVVILISFVNVLNHSFKTSSRNKELQNKILNTQLQLKEQELHYLKMQIHPHFLFNTLNTIYGFALKQSKQTPEIILKLSNLLDYILYQVNKPKVSLKEEVLHIKEYIDLEKIRFQDTLKVTFASTDIGEKMEIAPMLLIPFVENAFKHGSLRDGFLSVEIKIEVNENRLDFSIRNTTSEYEHHSEKQGIGLENIYKRLEFHYPNNHHLDIERQEDWYAVNFSIFNLNQNNNV